MNDKILKATHGSPDRPLRVGDLEIACYVLEGGVRVLSGRGMQSALALGQGHGAILKEFLGRNNLKPFISPDLAMVLSSPVRFIRPGRGGKVAVGYEATILADICDAVLAARKAKALTKKQLLIAEQCEILARAFARVGIIALVDEATGYQEARDRNELHRLLELYIAKELLPWAKRFPDEFYKELFRLRGWQYSPVNVKRPKLVGYLTNSIVYKKLPPGVLEELRKKNPIIQDGRRRYKHHQFLTENLGNPHLEKHLAVVTALMRASASWDSFRRLLERAVPGVEQQRDLFDDFEEDANE
jgi:hypothetical protein